MVHPNKTKQKEKTMKRILWIILGITLATLFSFSQQEGKIKIPNANDKHYYTRGILNVGDSYQPTKSLRFYGTDNYAQMTITFGDTIYIKTTVPVDSAGMLIINWTNKYYDWYVDSLKKENSRLKAENKNTESLIKRLLMKKQ